MKCKINRVGLEIGAMKFPFKIILVMKCLVSVPLA